MEDKRNSSGLTIPRHLYLDDTPYFITASTYQHQRLLNDETKDLLKKLLHEVFNDYGWSLDHWVILDNHYHLLVQSHRGKDLKRIIAKIHNLSAQQINRIFALEKRIHQKIWYNYWDYCPLDEHDYNVRLCYLLNNPVKHGYVCDLHNWAWSSFHRLFQEREKTKIREMFLEHREHHDLILPEDDIQESDS